ncbi:hypothetical protein E4K67_15090 [Desulfosporosinus fructosivorans]|uniref:HTH cro/C1-type domain-containing protein n=1 Tax=Desulfosporosinus fructosivorans TaxID=2018669 RepID=A0A4Z0R6A0_9FIRM|nr:hypothetical protein [Desulfosporosinus fructosivorans]TGE37196.1 hypothetical protein E4K67_15090 [Desulfosporosinus fructosivorans]
MGQLAENLRVLAWIDLSKKKQFLSRKDEWLVKELNISPDAAIRLLTRDEVLSDNHLSVLVMKFNLAEDVILSGSLLTEIGINIFQENMVYLIAMLKKIDISQKALAKEVGVDEHTISRWAKKASEPVGRSLGKFMVFIEESLGKSVAVDLSKERLFLELSPPGRSFKREELINLLNTLEDNELEELYPALIKLLN